MKRKAIIATVATIFAGIAVFALKSSSSSLLLENIKALADATPVKTCYLIGQGMNPQFRLFCDENTTPEMIYTCDTSMQYRSASGTSLCTIK